MPRVREYTSEVGTATDIPGRRASGADFGSGTGLAALAKATSEVGDVVQDNIERQEVSDVRSKLARARADWTVALQERASAADVGDPNFAAKFNEDFAANLGKMEERVSTKAGQAAFKQGAGELSAHFVSAAGLHQSVSMGVKAKQDYLGSLDAWRNVLVSDPTQFDSILRESTNSLKDAAGPYGRLSAEQRTALERQTRGELALSAVTGLIANGAPELAKRQLLAGKWDNFVDADKKATLIHNADVAERAKDSATERARLEAQRAKVEAQKAEMDGFLGRIVDSKHKDGPLSDAEILKNPVIDWNQKEHLIQYKLSRSRELAAMAENRTNPGNVRALMMEIHAGEDDPRKTYNADNVMEAYRLGRISTSEMAFLRREVEQLRDGSTAPFQKDVQNARNAVFTSITRSTLGQVQPEVAADAAYRWSRDLEDAITKKRKANEDPRVLLTPGHKEYMLSPSLIQSYMKTPGQALAERAAATVKAAEKISDAAVFSIDGGQPETVTTMLTYREHAKLTPGQQYTDPQGNVRTKQ